MASSCTALPACANRLRSRPWPGPSAYTRINDLPSNSRQPALDSQLSKLLPTVVAGNHWLMAVEGIVYLLHFERPYNGPMQHYVGFAADDLNRRLDAHREGTGGRTTRLAFNKGITFALARTWPGSAKTGASDQVARSEQLLPTLPSPPEQRHCPVQPDRCQWFCRGRSQSRVSAVFARIGDATSGSALYCDLSR